MTFRELACEHLARYKVEAMRVTENGLFRYEGRDLSMPHILPKCHHQMNILERYRKRFWSSDYANINLHRFFHHLNSSQALCINLFYPLIAENALAYSCGFCG